ncbi:alpha-2-macroglobulin-like protein 1 isoform X2 [Microcaecilia unicolor]|uniref:Alpha-2-macroglobulin-like protein 1 isoform X2 n=1 Tax=Microcaecilia unicolor TaxID=1415580 RepID=A0A6P7WPR4_9AMPH|nr:alpha-2-macroglobulin-like protein 1 isoform X2 [Microcaecilia unicolor]
MTRVYSGGQGYRTQPNPFRDTMWIGALLCSLLLGPAVGEPTQLNYVTVLPAVLEYPSEQTACVHISSFQGTRDLDITLLQGSKKTSLLSKKIKEPVPFQCVNFQVPAPRKGKTEDVSKFQVKIHSEGDAAVTETKQVLIRQKQSRIFIQTDKPIYKPEDIVKFRIVALDKNFIASNTEHPLVELQDPKQNRIGQWTNVTPRQGIVDLSFPLSSEPTFGRYTISLKEAGATQTFDVEEYVLPKFEVVIQLPKVVSCLDNIINFKVCGRYTYGKPVQGTIQSTLCRKRLGQGVDLCEELKGQTDRTGCISADIEPSANFTSSSSEFSPTLEAQATLVEDGTGVEINATATSSIPPYIATVAFDDSQPYYKAKLHYSGKLKLKGADGKPLENKKVLLKVQMNGKQIEEPYTTDESGLVPFTLNTSSWGEETITVTGEYNAEEKCGEVSLPSQSAQIRLTPFSAESKSFVKLRSLDVSSLSCDKEEQIMVDYIIEVKDLEEQTKHLDFFYLVVGKGLIRHHGTRKRDVNSEALKGSFSITLPVSADTAPSAHVLVYAMLPNGKLVADGAQYKISKCFKNKVKLTFSEEESLPGSNVDLQLQAAPGSLCATHAVDQSVLLMRSESELSINSVYNLFPEESGYPQSVDEYSCASYFPRPWLRPRPVLTPERLEPDYIWPDFMRPRPVPTPELLEPDYIWPDFMRPFPRTTAFDTFQLFKDASLKILTNSRIKKCDQPLHFPNFAFGPAGSDRMLMPRIVSQSAPIFPLEKKKETVLISESVQEEKVRQHFPESWLWDLVYTDSSGNLNLPVTVPDAITEWRASMFCTSDIGFGLSETSPLKVFKPFFVELTIPYSVKRTESFPLKATVFNYEKKCIMAEVTLLESSDFQLEPCSDCVYTNCLCASEAKTFTWNVTATKLGEVNFTVSAEALRTKKLCGVETPTVPKKGKRDTLIKHLLVQPEGILEEKTHSSLLCNGASEKVSLELPANIVEGSERAQVSVIADLMGRSLNNVDRLLAMPYGCGEQNMINFAPNVDILEYLGSTGQLTPEIKEKAKGFLESGYQRELNYKHNDGSYSAFGERDASGNTWLTAFVAKYFGRAKRIIFIDEKYITEAVNWLKSKQMESGCFQSVGKLIDNNMQGGVDDINSLSAYIIAVLLDLGIKSNDKMVQDAFRCLESSATNASSLYTKALLACAYTLAENEVKGSELLEQLEAQAITSGGKKYWSQTPEKAECETFWCQPRSVDTELTGYVLLARMSKKTVSAEDIATAMPVVRWLTGKQNAYGGFTSTQDTVVALQALAKYAKVTYSPSDEITLSVKHKDTVIREFSVNNENRLLLQQEMLSDIPGDYTLQISGKGCLYAQTALRYNVPPPSTHQTFLLDLELSAKDCNTLRIKIATSYIGNRARSNMALIEVKMLSGFIPVKDTVRWLQKHPVVKRTETKHNIVILYLEELSDETQTFTFLVEKDIPVKGLKPATVKIYDYYKPEDFAVREYNSPCA